MQNVSGFFFVFCFFLFCFFFSACSQKGKNWKKKSFEQLLKRKWNSLFDLYPFFFFFFLFFVFPFYFWFSTSNFLSLSLSLSLYIYIYIQIILLLWEFFSLAFGDVFSLKFVWQQVSSSLQDSSQYFSWS